MRASRPTAQVIPHAESDDVVEGLLAPRKRLPCRLLYDARGAELFEQICTLPEYYPTRVEKALLRAHLPAVTATVGPGARTGSKSCSRVNPTLSRPRASRSS